MSTASYSKGLPSESSSFSGNLFLRLIFRIVDRLLAHPAFIYCLSSIYCAEDTDMMFHQMLPFFTWDIGKKD